MLAWQEMRRFLSNSDDYAMINSSPLDPNQGSLCQNGKEKSKLKKPYPFYDILQCFENASMYILSFYLHIDQGGRQSPHHSPHFIENKTKTQLSDLFKILQPVKPSLEAKYSVTKSQALCTTPSCSKLLCNYLFYCTMLNISIAAVTATIP